MGSAPTQLRRRFVVGAVVLAIAGSAVVAGVIRGHDDTPAWAKPAPLPSAQEVHPRGGSVRVAVSTPPEPGDTGEGGATLRALTEPRLFDAQPDGSWRASLVQPGSDHAARDGLTAWFVLRKNASWSDGRAITVDDLRRTMEKQFVASVDDPSSSGVVRVRFHHKLPGWRRLWSETPIAPEDASVSGGPYAMNSATSGFETVLRRNPAWWGNPDAPTLDEIRLQYVPDATTQRQLLAAGNVDVIHPSADTRRIDRLRAMPSVTVVTALEGGATTVMRFNTDSVPLAARSAIAGAFPRSKFVGALLADEATEYRSAVPGGTTWNEALPEKTLDGTRVTLTVPIENPIATVFDAAFTRGVEAQRGIVDHRATTEASLTSSVAANSYDVALLSIIDSPDFCWQCRYGAVDQPLARQADSGDRKAAMQLEQKVRESSFELPLWRTIPVVAFRTTAVKGVVANGYTGSAAWDAASWWKP